MLSELYDLQLRTWREAQATMISLHRPCDDLVKQMLLDELRDVTQRQKEINQKILDARRSLLDNES